MRILTLLSMTLPLWLGAAAACSKKEKKEDSTATAESGDSAEAASGSPLMQELKTVAENCKVNVEHSVVSQCKNKEKRDLIRDFRRDQRNRLDALPTLVGALEGDDQKVQTVAARVLEGAYRGSFGDVQPGGVDKALAKRLLAVLPKLGKRQANQVVPAVVHAAMLAGEQSALFETLNGIGNKTLTTAAYSHLLTHGDANAMAKVTEVANSEDRQTASAAMQAARNYRGNDEAMKQKICALGEDKLSSTNGIVAMRAAQILVHCGENSIDKLLQELEERTKSETMTTGLVRSLYELCQTKKDEKLGSEAQCKRMRSMLEAWIRDTELSAELRAASLFELGVQFADEEAEALCKSLENSPELRVKTAAREAVRRMQRRRNKGKNVVNVGGGATPHERLRNRRALDKSTPEPSGKPAPQPSAKPTPAPKAAPSGTQ